MSGSKTELTPQEALMVAHGAEISGIDQHQLAAVFGINQARIAEAVVAMRWAALHHKEIYKLVKGGKRAATVVVHEAQGAPAASGT